jgi:integrase
VAGQIIKRDEKTWTVRIFLGRQSDGKRKYFNKTVRGSKKDAQMWLTAKLREKDLGMFVEPASISLNAYLDQWLEEIARAKVREATFDGYVAKLKVHVRPTIGLKRLSDLQAHDIQKLYNDMTRRGLSAKTVRHVHNVLSPSLKQAVKWRLLSQNPCDLCELPRIAKREMQCFTPEETAVFLQYAKSDRYYAAFVLAIETGMRPEEYLGLKWSDIDFGSCRLSVRRALVVRKGGGFAFTEPKTPQSRRSIPLSQSAIAVLKSHRKEQLEARMLNRDVYEENDLVFPSELGTPTLYGNLDRRHFKKIIQAAGLKKIRLYDLRHTMATLLLSKGLNPKIVSERLGHSSIALTLDTYSHVLPTMQRDATEHMEKMMFAVG